MRNKAGKNRLIYLFVFTLLFLVLVFCIVFETVHTAAASADLPCKYYTSIQIQEGDTLWSIADTYYDPFYEEITSYIKEVCMINHLLSEDDIHAGEYITIPYYIQTF